MRKGRNIRRNDTDQSSHTLLWHSWQHISLPVLPERLYKWWPQWCWVWWHSSLGIGNMAKACSGRYSGLAWCKFGYRLYQIMAYLIDGLTWIDGHQYGSRQLTMGQIHRWLLSRWYWRIPVLDSLTLVRYTKMDCIVMWDWSATHWPFEFIPSGVATPHAHHIVALTVPECFMCHQSHILSTI